MTSTRLGAWALLIVAVFIMIFGKGHLAIIGATIMLCTAFIVDAICDAALYIKGDKK